MQNNFPTGDIPSGATMRPQYMGRTMTTYPVSEPEMEQISSLSSAVTTRVAIASFLAALSAGIWTNAIFATELTPAGTLATTFIAPLLLLFAAGYGMGALFAQNKRASAWEKIKNDASPVQTVAEAGGLIVSGSRPSRRMGR